MDQNLAGVHSEEILCAVIVKNAGVPRKIENYIVFFVSCTDSVFRLFFYVQTHLNRIL